MKLAYDKDLQVAGVGMVPWSRLGPEQWFPKYVIASPRSIDAIPGLPPLLSLDIYAPETRLPRNNTTSLLESSGFQALLNGRLTGYDLLLYKATQLPHELLGRKFLMADIAVAQEYENKILFRQKFSNVLPFPTFKVVAKQDLVPDIGSFEQLIGGSPGLVLQDEQLSGGKGTHLVSDLTSYRQAIEALDTNSRTRVLVSHMVTDPLELSIQACVTRYGVYSGPLQRQIIREPVLVNATVTNGNTFCGIEILATDQGSAAHLQAQQFAQLIGLQLQQAGYCGIFGVDMLQDTKGQLLVIEVNPRITGATSLLSALYGPEEAVPFYALHILELGGYDYQIMDDTAMFMKDGSSLMLYSLVATPQIITAMPLAGTYRFTAGKLSFVRHSIMLDELETTEEFVFRPFVHVAERIASGGLLGNLLFKRPIIDLKTKRLYNDVIAILSSVRENIITQL